MKLVGSDETRVHAHQHRSRPFGGRILPRRLIPSADVNRMVPPLSGMGGHGQAPRRCGENRRVAPPHPSTMARFSDLFANHRRGPKLSELDPKRPRHARHLGRLRRASRDVARAVRRYRNQLGKVLQDPRVQVGFVLGTSEFQALQGRDETDRLTYREAVKLYTEFAETYHGITGSGSQVRGKRRQAGNLLIVAMLSATRGRGVWLRDGTDVNAETLVNALAEAWCINPRTIRRAWEGRNAHVQ